MDFLGLFDRKIYHLFIKKNGFFSDTRGVSINIEYGIVWCCMGVERHARMIGFDFNSSIQSSTIHRSTLLLLYYLFIHLFFFSFRFCSPDLHCILSQQDGRNQQQGSTSPSSVSRYVCSTPL